MGPIVGLVGTSHQEQGPWQARQVGIKACAVRSKALMGAPLSGHKPLWHKRFGVHPPQNRVNQLIHKN
jgi:hypothetical protein